MGCFTLIFFLPQQSPSWTDSSLKEQTQSSPQILCPEASQQLSYLWRPGPSLDCIFSIPPSVSPGPTLGLKGQRHPKVGMPSSNKEHPAAASLAVLWWDSWSLQGGASPVVDTHKQKVSGHSLTSPDRVQKDYCLKPWRATASHCKQMASRWVRWPHNSSSYVQSLSGSNLPEGQERLFLLFGFMFSYEVGKKKIFQVSYIPAWKFASNWWPLTTVTPQYWNLMLFCRIFYLHPSWNTAQQTRHH